MKILITGGYGFIGSFVAQQFYQEGSEIFILDNLSSGDKSNVGFKHKSVQLSVEDRNCEELFRNNRFDVVVHLAAQVNASASEENPRLDTQSNVLGLTNMLSLSRKYGVRKFIFASSAAVYGTNDQVPLPETAACDPVSPNGINKWIGEMYCSKWHSLYGLETVCFRLSNVYGPRQGRAAEGVVSVFTERAIHGKDLPVFGDGEQTRDFIYVEDVAEAIYRSSYSNLCGVYNLSSGSEVSVNELCGMLRRIHGGISVSHKDGRPGDIYRSALDNQKLITDLEWAPKYSLEEGLQKTYNSFLEERPLQRPKRSQTVSDKPSPLGKALRILLPYGENALTFGFTVWLTFAVQDGLNHFIDFKLIYIIIVGIMYGNRQSIIAVAMSSALYVSMQMANGREFVSLLFDTELFFQIAVYLFFGLIVGYAIERKNRAIVSRDHRLEDLQEKHTFLNEVYNETRLVKDELQQQIMNNGDSFGKIYSITKELESLEPEKILASTVSVVESIMKSKSVTIYTVNKYASYLRLAARSNAEGFDAPKSMKVADFPYLEQLLLEKRLFVNKDLSGDVPLLSAPVLNNGEVVAIISIHNMKFDNFTLYYQNLFKIIVDLITSALSRAFTYVVATGSQRYMEGTPILIPEVFAEIMESKHIARAKHGIEFVLLTAGDANLAPKDLPQRISGSLRETDYIGIGENGHLMVLLANSNNEDASFVLDRFRKNGISMEIVEKDLRYV